MPNSPPGEAVVEGRKCQILGYRGKGRFVVLVEGKKTTEIVHRGQLRFIKENRKASA